MRCPHNSRPSASPIRPSTRLAQSIEVVHDPEQVKLYPGLFAAWVEVETAPGSGRVARDDPLDPSGYPNNPQW
jgi:hypothetical protein